MNFTKEQKAVIRAEGHCKINAVAGSGKTTTVIAYAKARPAEARILYLAFNRSVRQEARQRFAETGLRNVRVETAHSLAYRHVVPRHGYEVKGQGYKTHEIAELLGLQVGGAEKHAEFVVANHISKFVAYFCNSAARKVQQLDYRELVTEEKARQFVERFYGYIEKQTRILLAKMNRGQIGITHDFYLKKFQLTQPELGFDYILFDEGQDASPAMLDVFLRQRGTKVIVGDTHQQIYGWRFAVNSLEKADFTTRHLSTSFRFGQDIADLAREVLNLKHYLKSHEDLPITGAGDTAAKPESRAILARTNLGLLLRAIEHVTERHRIKPIYFEGNIHSYTYADEGTSLYDVLSLYNQNRERIRDKLIRRMGSIEELEEYVKNTDEGQLGIMIEIVKEYGNEIPRIIKQIKENHIDDDDKSRADVVFSTVHRCKGMEYDEVELVNDFIMEEQLQKMQKKREEEAARIPRLIEEINLLYVAITRARLRLKIPDTLIPSGFTQNSPQIDVLPVAPKAEKSSGMSRKPEAKTRTTKKQPRNAGQPWTSEQDATLEDMFNLGLPMSELSQHFGRTRGSIRARLRKLGLLM
mgnify:CR=1 FL=1